MDTFWLDFELLIPVVALTGVFVVAVVVVYSHQKRREREAYYRHELAKAVVARGGDPDEVARIFAGESRLGSRRRIEVMKLGAFLLLAVGVGTMILLGSLVPEVWAAGVIPTLLGVALLAFAVSAGRSRAED